MTTVAAVAGPDLRGVWQRARVPVLLAVLAVGAVLALAAVLDAPPARPLDPRDASPAGARALATLLGARGVTVRPVDRPAPAGPGTTTFVPDPAGLTRAQLRQLASAGGDLVVIAPGRRELAALGVAASTGRVTSEATVPAGCGLPAAQVAGPIRYSGRLYAALDPSAPGTACYRVGPVAGLLVVPAGTGRISVLGSTAALSNAWLDEEGNAALGLGLLGGADRVDWVLPRPPTQAPADARHRGLVELLPGRVRWTLAATGLALLLLALWRARRLGPVVVEPLPVVVRADETVVGRARLMRAARARGAAAEALRTAALGRLRGRLGLPEDADVTTVTDAVTRRTGRADADVTALLAGEPPRDDAQLTRLAGELDAVEQAVRDR